jgi:hypothetical protein
MCQVLRMQLRFMDGGMMLKARAISALVGIFPWDSQPWAIGSLLPVAVRAVDSQINLGKVPGPSVSVWNRLHFHLGPIPGAKS